MKLPNLVIGGAPRSGTTFLCEVLAKHPGIYVAQPFIPEPKVLLMPAPDGDRSYLARYEALFTPAPAGTILVEKSSHYLENDDARARFQRLLPETRIVFILREPIARAYSNWRWSKKNALEPLSFEESIALEGRRPSPFPPEREYVRPHDYMRRSSYGSLIRAWVEAIGADRIAVYQFEAVIDDPTRLIQDLQLFARVDPLDWKQLRTGVVNAGIDDVPIQPEVLDSLRQRLAPEMRLLAAYADIDLRRWNF